MIFSPNVLVAFAQQALAKAGMDDKSGLVADILVQADLLGHDTHGLALLPAYVEALLLGSMLGVGEHEVVRDHGAVAHWDGHWLSGVSLIAAAVDKAADKAQLYGIGAVSIRHAHHTACLQAYLERATSKGLMVIIASSDPTSSTVAPYGGLDPVFGPDPIAVGIPTTTDPILIDMSSSITTNGMVARVAKEGGRLTGQWLQDHQGNLTDDPGVMTAKARGSMLLAGGHDHGQKGYGLALMVESLSQGLSGGGRKVASPRWTASVFVQVLDPSAFVGSDAFVDEIDHLVWLCHQSRVGPGLTEPSVRVPGEQAQARRRQALKSGVELRTDTILALDALSAKLGIPPLAERQM